MRKTIKLVSMLVAAIMMFGLVALIAPAPAVRAAADDKPLVVGYDAFSEKFSPYYGETAYDMDIAELTQIGLLTTDRAGGIIYKAIEGETVNYNGVDYEYKGISDLEVTIDEEANETRYNFKIREDLVFSDGEPLTADDIIFTMYALIDPAYTGSSSLYSVPIKGVRDYRTQTSSAVYDKYLELYKGIEEAGRDHEWSDSDPWTEEQQNYVWDAHLKNMREGIDKLIEYELAKYGAAYGPAIIGAEASELAENEGLKTAFAMALWGFGDVQWEEAEAPAPEETEAEAEETEAEAEETEAEAEETEAEAEETEAEAEEAEAEEAPKKAVGLRYEAKDGQVFEWKFDESYPTADDYYEAALAGNEGDVIAFLKAELEGTIKPAYSELKDQFISHFGSQDEEMGGEGVPNVEGIKKLGDYEVEITTVGFDASAVYKLGVSVTPLHYYGSKDLYDYDNNKFGLEFGNQDHIKSVTAKPLGAGPYKFDRYENKIVYMEANEHYYKGAPKTKYLQFRETGGTDRVPGIVGGTIDVAIPSLTTAVVDEIKSHNDNNELTGNLITTNTVDNLGYGYIGLNAGRVKVGEDAQSAESKNLRKGFATIFARLRGLTVDSYYGERASVINYPISNTSWAAPRPADDGYRVAFSLDVDGNEIYTDDMDEDAKLEAAKQAAIGYFKAAGYTFDDASGKFTAAPDGAKMSYEVIIPAEGGGDHPSFLLLTKAKEVLQEIGLDIEINDPADSNVLWQKINAAEQEIWCAAWSATIDPDMYQIYFSNNIVGMPGSTESNHYHIQDEELDKLIMDARTSADQSFRKTAYKAALDIIMDWGVEIPIYQRQNCVIFSTERLNLDTVTPDITTFWGWMSEIELIEMQ